MPAFSLLTFTGNGLQSCKQTMPKAVEMFSHLTTLETIPGMCGLLLLQEMAMAGLFNNTLNKKRPESVSKPHQIVMQSFFLLDCWIPGFLLIYYLYLKLKTITELCTKVTSGLESRGQWSGQVTGWSDKPANQIHAAPLQCGQTH